MTKLELQIAFSFYFIEISNPPSSHAYFDPPIPVFEFAECSNPPRPPPPDFPRL